MYGANVLDILRLCICGLVVSLTIYAAGILRSNVWKIRVYSIILCLVHPTSNLRITFPCRVVDCAKHSDQIYTQVEIKLVEIKLILGGQLHGANTIRSG